MSIYLTQLAADNFQRANVSPLASPWTLDQFGDPGLQIVSDVCEATELESFCVQLYSYADMPNDQYASMTLGSNFNNEAFVFIRLTDNGSTISSMPGYRLAVEWSSGSTYVWLLVDPVDGPIADGVTTANPGDVFTLAAIGTTSYVLQNGTQLGTVSSSRYSSGLTALSVSPETTLNGTYVTGFAMGSASNTPPPPPSGNTVPWSGPKLAAVMHGAR